MPNWCYNSATISGPKEDLVKFVKAISSPIDEETREDYDLTLPFPTPKELVETTAGHYTAEPNSNWAKLLANGEITQEWHDELVRNNAEGYAKDQANLAKYGYKNWYDWNIDNWGTKWSPRVEDFDLHDDATDGQWRVEVRYETAWAPPTKLIAKLSELFPTLKFYTTFDEESQAFVGCEIFTEGQVFGTYFEPCGKDLPEGFAERWEAIRAKFENDDDDAFQDLLDFQSDLTDVAELEAERLYEEYLTSK